MLMNPPMTPPPSSTRPHPNMLHIPVSLLGAAIVRRIRSVPPSPHSNPFLSLSLPPSPAPLQFILMRLDVLAEMVAAHESLAAYGTPEAFLARVRADMPL